MDLDELDEIDEAECWRLIGTQPVGRFGVKVGDYPLIFPVNHSVVAHGVVFRTAPGSKLWATRRSNVSFEVDHIDPDTRSGWSVLIRGSAREISAETANPELVDVVAGAAPESWAPGRREHLVRIVADSITGRRIHHGEPDRPEGCL